MIQISPDIHSAYTFFIEQRGVKAGDHRYYVKWLRYYLDFCHKYNFKQTAQVSLSAFLEKLKEKKQAESLRKQAHHAVSLFYEMGQLSDRKTRNGTSNSKSAAYKHTKPDIFLLILKRWRLIKLFSLVVKQSPRAVNQVLTPIWRSSKAVLTGLRSSMN